MPTGLPRRHTVAWLPLWRLEHRAADSSWHLFAGQRKQINKQLCILVNRTTPDIVSGSEDVILSYSTLARSHADRGVDFFLGLQMLCASSTFASQLVEDLSFRSSVFVTCRLI